MKFKSLEITAFNRLANGFMIPLDGQGIILVEGENRDYGDAGDSNGSGKSLVAVEGLLWIGWGKMARTGDSPVTTDAMHPVFGAHGTLSIDDYVFRRQRILKKATFTATRTDGSPVALSKDPSKRRDDIEDVLKMDYLGVRSAIVITDGKGGNLVESSFGQQMATLESLLRMDELAKAAKIAASKAADEKMQLITRDNELTLATRLRSEATDALTKLKDSTVDVQLRAQIETLSRQCQDIDALEATVFGLDEQLRIFTVDKKLDAAFQHASQLVAQHEVKIGTINQTLRSAICPTCKQPLKKVDRPALERELVEAQNGLVGARTALKLHVDAIATINTKRSSLATQLSTIHTTIKQRDNLQQSILLYQETLKLRETALADVEALISSRTADVQAAQQRVTDTKLALARATWWSSAYGRDGLQAEVFASALPIVNDACARYAQVFFNGHVQVQFNPFREGRSDDLIRITGMSATKYDLLSEGEKARVRLIAAFAMRALARWRLSEPINLSIYDEVFDRLDTAALTNVARLLEQEAAIPGATVIVVTHSPALKALFPSAKVLRVTRQNHEATVRWV